MNKIILVFPIEYVPYLKWATQDLFQGVIKYDDNLRCIPKTRNYPINYMLNHCH